MFGGALLCVSCDFAFFICRLVLHTATLPFSYGYFASYMVCFAPKIVVFYKITLKIRIL